MALANGAKTEKLKYGHRGANQPVSDQPLDRVFITSQNHGYAVVSGTLDPEICFVATSTGMTEAARGSSIKA